MRVVRVLVVAMLTMVREATGRASGSSQWAERRRRSDGRTTPIWSATSSASLSADDLVTPSLR